MLQEVAQKKPEILDHFTTKFKVQMMLTVTVRFNGYINLPPEAEP